MLSISASTLLLVVNNVRRQLNSRYFLNCEVPMCVVVLNQDGTRYVFPVYMFAPCSPFLSRHLVTALLIASFGYRFLLLKLRHQHMPNFHMYFGAFLHSVMPLIFNFSVVSLSEIGGKGLSCLTLEIISETSEYILLILVLQTEFRIYIFSSVISHTAANQI